MTMVDGRNLTPQEVTIYNQGEQGRRVAIQHYNQRVYGSWTAPQEQQPQPPQRTLTVAPQVAQALQRSTVGRTLLASPSVNVAQPRTQTPTTQPVDLKALVSAPKPASGTYQAKPGGALLVSTPEQNARLLAEKQLPFTQYKQQYGYTPQDPGYLQEIDTITSELDQQRQYLRQVKTAQEGATFTIDNKKYSRQEAIEYMDKTIDELVNTKAYLERAKQAGYILNKTEKGYSFSLPKASEVVKQVYGGERPDIYTAKAMTDIFGLGFVMAGTQQLLTGQPSLEAWKEETAQSILGTTRRPGESIAEYTGRFAGSPEAITNIWLNLITLGTSKLVTTVGKVVAPELLSAGSRLAGFTSKVADVGLKTKNLIGKLPESVKVVGRFATTSPIGQQVTKYGFFGAMEAPMLIETAQTQPELLGMRLGKSLAGYEAGMFAIEKSIGILGKGVAEIRQPGFAQKPIGERIGTDRLVNRLGYDTATQPLPGAKRFVSSKGMTEAEIQKADEMMARGYKEPKPRGLSPEETELTGLSESFNKKPGLKGFLKDETGGQPLPGARRLTSSRGMTEKELQQADEMLARGYKEPKPRVTPEDTELQGLSESFNKSFGGKKEIRQPTPTRTEPVREDLISIPKSYKSKYEPKTETIDLIEEPGKKSRIKDILLGSDEASQPIFPGLIKRGKKEKKAIETLLKSEETSQPSPGIRPKEPTTPPPKELLFTESTGRVTTIEAYEPFPNAQILTEKTPRGVATLIEEFPRKGTLEIGEATKTGERLTIPGSYEKEVTQLGAGKRRLDLIEAKPGEPTGKLIATESKRGTPTIAVFRPGEKIQFEGLMGVKRTTPVSKIGLGKQEPSLMETMPLTKEQALEYQAQRLTGHIGFQPKEGWEKGLKNYYKETSEGLKTGGADVRGVISDTDIMGFEIKQARKGNVFDIGRDIDSKIDFYGKKYERIKFGGKETKYQPSELRSKVNKLLWEDKGTPGLRATYIGKRGRTSVSMIEEPTVPVGTRPEGGWGDYIKGVQTEDIETIRYTEGIKRQMRKKALEDKTVRPITPGRPSTPLKYERQLETKVSGETPPVTSGDTGLVSVTKKETTKTEKGFKPSGLYESPNMEYITVERPLSRGEARLLSNVEKDAGGMSIRWEGVRPKIEKAKQYEAGGLIDTLRKPGEKLQYSSSLEGKGLGSMLFDLQDVKRGLISEREQRQTPGMLQGLISQQRYDELLGTKQEEDTRQSQISMSLQEQLQEQLQETEQKQETKDLSIFDTFTDTRTKTPIEPTTPRPRGEITPRIRLPPRKKDEPSDEYLTSKETTEGKGYDVYVKERSMYKGEIRKPTKFTKMNRSPLSYKDALSLGGEITDTTSAVSFRLKKVKEKPTKPDKPIQDYGTRSYKFNKKGETFIEKPDYRMDTPGELRGISSLGHEARREQGKQLNIYTHRKRNNSDLLPVKTPRNRSTGLLSRTTKIRETGLFKKKKRGKNNAYY
jgi:hypothetical protein